MSVAYGFLHTFHFMNTCHFMKPLPATLTDLQMFQLMTCSVRVHLTCLTQAPRDTVPHLMGALAGTEAASVVATCNNPPRASDSLFTHAPLQASSTSQVLPAPSYIAIVQYHRMSYTMSLAPLIRCANVAWAMPDWSRDLQFAETSD